jgi:hypothetical protein
MLGWDSSDRGGAIHECEEHGWAKDRVDRHARDRALLVAHQDPPPGVSPVQAVSTARDVLDSIGDISPDCPPARSFQDSSF